MRVVARGHRHAPDFRALAQVASTARLAQVLVFVIEVADLANRGHALHRQPADLARRHAHLGELAFLGQQLRGGAGRTDDLAAPAGHELDVVDGGAEGDIGDR